MLLCTHLLCTHLVLLHLDDAALALVDVVLHVADVVAESRDLVVQILHHRLVLSVRKNMGFIFYVQIYSTELSLNSDFLNSH